MNPSMTNEALKAFMEMAVELMARAHTVVAVHDSGNQAALTAAINKLREVL